MRKLPIHGLVLFILWMWVQPAMAERNLVDDVVLAADVVNAVFNPQDQVVLDGYLEETYEPREERDEGKGKSFKKGKKQKSLPKGLQKKIDRGGQLPPGWQKKVERGEVLDQDVYRHARPLPERYLSRLGDQPEGTSVLQVDDRIIRVHDATRTIVDVFFPGQ